MHFLNMFFFDIYPYIAGTVFWWEAGCVMTMASTRRAASSQMLDRKGMNTASNLFHIGILGIFAGHFTGMLTPHWMYEAWLPIEVKQKMAMLAGGACGVMTGGWAAAAETPSVQPTRAGYHDRSGHPDPLPADGAVCAGSADHSILCAAYGRQRDDEAGGMGAVCRDLPRWCL